MKDILSKETTKNDVENVKTDIKNLMDRLGSLKDHSIEEISEQIDNLSNTLTSLKDKGIGMGRENLAAVMGYTRKHPCRMLMSAFGLGLLLSCLIKRK